MAFERTWKSARSALGYLVAAERGPGWRRQYDGDRIQVSRVESEHHAIAAILYGRLGVERDSSTDRQLRRWATERGVILSGHQRRVVGQLKDEMRREGMLSNAT